MTQPVTGDSVTEVPASGGDPEGSGVEDGGTIATEGTAVVTPPAPAGKTYTEAEYAALQARMRAADQRAGQREAELQQIRDKDLPEIEKLTRDLNATAERATKAEADLRETRIQNAFLASPSKIEWHNAGTALKLLDMDKVDITDDGTVTGMDAAIQALAKSHPYLVKPGAETPTEPETRPGTVPANTGNKGTPTGRDLSSRLPAMRSRQKTS